MPIYEYECLECGTHFDLLQRFGELAEVSCPRGHQSVRRLFSQPAIIFKGSGFYITDHRGNGHSKSDRRGRVGQKAAPEPSTDNESKVKA